MSAVAFKTLLQASPLLSLRRLLSPEVDVDRPPNPRCPGRRGVSALGVPSGCQAHPAECRSPQQGGPGREGHPASKMKGAGGGAVRAVNQINIS